MAIPITIPRLGWNMEEGVFAGWRQANGSTVRVGEPLFTLESDKATEEIECLDAGILRIPPSGPREGDKVAVGMVIGYLVQPGEVTDTLPPSPSVLGESGVGGKGAQASADSASSPPTPLPLSTGREGGTALYASPRARRVAAELGTDWKQLRGTGRNGRIRERDVRAAIDCCTPGGPDAAIAVSPIRRMIAEHMLASHRSTAPVTLTTTTDATNLVNLRRQFRAVNLAVIPSYTDFLVKLTAFGLQKHPLLNARWDDNRITMSSGIHIGIAVDTDVGLLVPVLRDVPSLGLKELASRSHELIARARQGKLKADEMQGGTFTVTNLGAYDIETFTPLIHSSQCAVLGIGRIQRQPVVIEEQIVVRDRIALSLTFDHRIVDGGPAARFLQTVSALIENPGPWLTL
jgi:pyruvate dehydrogenase E2 component (dihydrolipoamide acetyltransferase)